MSIRLSGPSSHSGLSSFALPKRELVSASAFYLANAFKEWCVFILQGSNRAMSGLRI